MGIPHTVSVRVSALVQTHAITPHEELSMNRAARIVAYSLAAACLAACAGSPTGPTAIKCNPLTGSSCSNADFVNPHVDFVNPHVDFVNPHV